MSKISNKFLAQMSALTIKGNNTGSAANPVDMTVAQLNAILPVFTNTLNGLTPLSGGGTANFLRADGTWTAPSGINTDDLQLTNLGIAASASSGTLTVSLKQADGATDPASGTGAVSIGIRNPTATTGGYNVRSVTAALSQTLTVGNQLGFGQFSSTEYLWAYAIDSDGAGTIKLGMSSARYDDGTLVSTVADAPVVTISQASPAVITLAGHGWNNGDMVCFRSVGGTIPSPISLDVGYFVVSRATNTFEISATVGGTPINTTTAGSGTFHAYVADSRIVSAAVYANVSSRLIGRIIAPLTNVSVGYSAPTEIAIATPAVAASISPNGSRFAMQGRNQGSMVPSVSTSVSTSNFPFALSYTANSDGSVNDYGAKGDQAIRLNSTSVTNTLPIARGGTNLAALPTTPTASVFSAWDANKNFSANNFIEGYTTTATAAGTTILTVSSTFQQYFTGTSTQTVTLPNVSGLVLGMQFQVTNNSTGVVTVQSSGANTIALQAANTTVLYTCILTTGTTAASWNALFNGSIGAISPTIQKFTTGTAQTYTTPSGVQYIRVRMVGGGGGGGGGAGAGNSNGGTGGTGGNTTFGTSLLTANGGVGGVCIGAGGVGGTASLGSGPVGTALGGGQGGGSQQLATTTNYAMPGIGASTPFGSGGSNGSAGANGIAPAANTGAGGGGGSVLDTGVTNAGSGGGAGAYVDAIITSPASTYAYSVGALGSAGTAGTSGNAGGAGAAGYIEVTEYYSSGVASSGGGAYTPTVQKFTTGTSQTYTTPSNISYIKVRMVGGGGGGGGNSTGGGNGGDTTFGTSLLTAGGGPGGSSSGVGVAGGTASVTTPAVGTSFSGGSGQSSGANAAQAAGGAGGSSVFGGAGKGFFNGTGAGSAGATNTGGGGGGGAVSGASGGGGGGSGGFVDAIIISPSATYTYTVGASGSAGTGTGAGGAGAAGYIEVTEYYNNGAVGTATVVTGGSQPNITTLNSATGVLINGLTATTPTTGQIGETITANNGGAAVATNTSTTTNIVSITLTAGVWYVTGGLWDDNVITQTGSNGYLYTKSVLIGSIGQDEFTARRAVTQSSGYSFPGRVVVVAAADADKTITLKSLSVTAAGSTFGYVTAVRIA